jgi:hypothetical protein
MSQGNRYDTEKAGGTARPSRKKLQSHFPQARHSGTPCWASPLSFGLIGSSHTVISYKTPIPLFPHNVDSLCLSLNNAFHWFANFPSYWGRERWPGGLRSRGLQFYTFFGISIGIKRRLIDIAKKFFL